MTGIFLRKGYILILFLVVSYASLGQKITDTIYYNSRWGICEKAVAAYYRLGTLSIDSVWVYTGNFSDNTIENKLVSTGKYSEDGKRDGLFECYYPSGVKEVTGQYSLDNEIGNWEWYYPDGTKKATINFHKGDYGFHVVDFRDEKGVVTCKLGNGTFSWLIYPYHDVGRGYMVEGSFRGGKRSGTWNYYDVNGRKYWICKEVYEPDGIFKKGKMLGLYSDTKLDSNRIKFDFTSFEIRQTEAIKYDEFFRKNGIENADFALRDFLVNKKPTEIKIRDSAFENAFSFVLYTLNNNRTKIDHIAKEPDGIIEFRIGENNYPENITIQAKNLLATENEFLFFLMNKFRNMEMPATGKISYDSYHKIYFYVINAREFAPIEFRNAIKPELIFSHLKKEQFMSILKEHKREIKQNWRNQYYWWR